MATLAKTKAETAMLIAIAQSWTRIANQIDRYEAWKKQAGQDLAEDGLEA